MYSIRVEVSPSLTNFLTQYPQLFEAAKKKAVNKSLDHLQKTSFAKAPYKFGNLRRELKQRYSEKKLVAGTDVSRNYAEIQDRGGTIKAKGKGWLRFMAYGSWHTVKQVVIPGKHYFFDNAEEQKGNVLNLFIESFKELLSRV